MTGPGCGWSKISRVRAPYDNLDPAVKPLQSPESAVYIMDSLLAWLIRPRKQSRSGRIAIVALLGGLFILGVCHFPGMLQPRAGPSGRTVPNLLLIIADDQSGLCLGAAGDQRGATPHLDALARQGVLCDRTFCNSPLCAPSRQSFITGLLPHASGVTRLETQLPEKALTLGRWLSILGYRTAAIGKMHFNGPSRHGFDTQDRK